MNILINLYDHAKNGHIDMAGALTEKEKIDWYKKAMEYRDEIAKLIMKGLK